MSSVARLEHRLLLLRGSCTTSTWMCLYCTTLAIHIHVLHGGLCRDLRHACHSCTTCDDYHKYNCYTTRHRAEHDALHNTSLQKKKYIYMKAELTSSRGLQTHSVPRTCPDPTPDALDTTLDHCRWGPAYQTLLGEPRTNPAPTEPSQVGVASASMVPRCSTARLPAAVPGTATTPAAKPTRPTNHQPTHTRQQCKTEPGTRGHAAPARTPAPTNTNPNR